MSSFFPARVPGLRTGKNDTIPRAPEAPEAPVAPEAVTVNRRLDMLQYEKKIIVFGSKSRLALLQNEKTGAKNRNSRCYGGFSEGFKGSLREFV